MDSLTPEMVDERLEIVEKGKFDFFSPTVDVKIRYAIWQSERTEPRGTMIVVPGRAEFIEKFYDTISAYLKRGFSVVAMDWRGQGLSTRFVEDRQKDYVPDFSILTTDLHQLITKVLPGKIPSPIYITANSMGGAPTMKFLHDYPGLIKAAVFWVPMLGVNYKPIPRFIGEFVPAWLCKMGLETKLGLGEKPYKRGMWGWRKTLTHDMQRFEDHDFFTQREPGLEIGGVTNGWVAAAQRIFKFLHGAGVPESIETPILMVQAEKDTLVDNDAHISYAKRLPNVGLVRIEGAYHELHKESDIYRDQLWHAVDHFLDGLDGGDKVAADG